MSAYAFCPKCEERTMVEFNRYYLESDPSKCFIFVNCGKCGMVLNLDKWIKVTVMEDEDGEGRPASSFWNLIFGLLPHQALIWFNAFCRRVIGSYLLPDLPPDMEIPEIVESVITQVEEMSGEKWSGDFDDFEEFMDNGIKAIVDS